MIRRAALGAFLAAAAVAAAGCGGSDKQPTDVVLVTHDSFAISPDVKKAFEEESGLKLEDPEGGRRGRGRHARAPHRRQPRGGRALRLRQQPARAGARRRRLRAVRAAGARERRPGARARSRAPRDADRPRRRVPQLRQGLVRRAAASRRREASPTSRSPATAISSSSRTRRRRRPGSRSCSRRSPSSGTGGRTTGASSVRTASSSSTAGRTPTTHASRARREARAIGRWSSRTRRAHPPRSSSRSPGRARLRPASSRRAASARSSSRACCAARRTRRAHAKLVDFMLSKRFQEDIPLQMFVFPARTRCRTSAGVRALRGRARASARASARRDRPEPRELGGHVDGHRGEMSPRAWRAVTVGVPLAFLALFFLYPLAAILDRGLRGAGDPPLDVLTDPLTREVVWFTVWQALASTLLTIALATPAAYVLGRYRFRGRSVVGAIVVVPFVLPTVVVALAFLAILPDGLERGWAPILVAHAFFNVAVVVRIVGTFWANLDPRIGEAAATLGASPVARAREITLPLLAPALAAASAIVFLFSFTSFGIVLVLGGPRYATVEAEIYNQAVRLFDLRAAAVLSLVQLACVVAAVWVATRLERRLVVTGTLRGGARHAAARANRARQDDRGGEPGRARPLPRPPARRPRRAVAGRGRRPRPRRLPGARRADERPARVAVGGDRELDRLRGRGVRHRRRRRWARRVRRRGHARLAPSRRAGAHPTRRVGGDARARLPHRVRHGATRLPRRALDRSRRPGARGDPVRRADHGPGPALDRLRG